MDYVTDVDTRLRMFVLECFFSSFLLRRVYFWVTFLCAFLILS